jgi:hypothetical protein
MKHTRLFLLPTLVLSLAAAPASVGEMALLRQEIVTARQALVTMVLHRDKRGPEQQLLVKETAARVSSTLGMLRPPVGKEAQFSELKSTWEAFRRTREKELVPAVLAGDKDRYDRLALGIQKDRLDRMYALLSQMEK